MGRCNSLAGHHAVPAVTRTVRVITVAAVALFGLFPTGSASAHRHRDFRAERVHIEERGRSVRGTSYRYGGSSPRTGFDCSGFTRWVFADHGAELPHSSIDQFYLGRRNGYKRVWKRSNLEVGDLVFFKTTSARVGHVGIYIGNGNFIHSSSAAGSVVIHTLREGYYRERFVGATRVPATMRY